MIKLLEKLELIKEIAEKDIQEAVKKLYSYSFDLEDMGLVEPDEGDIYSRYVEYGNIENKYIVNISEVEFNKGLFYYYEDTNARKEGYILKEITKESILNTISEFENLIKEYTIDAYEIESPCKNEIYYTIIKDTKNLIINYADKNSKIIKEVVINSLIDMPLHFRSSDTNKIYVTKIINGEYVGEKSLLIEF
jgi:hypothetical protein